MKYAVLSKRKSGNDLKSIKYLGKFEVGGRNNGWEWNREGNEHKKYLPKVMSVWNTKKNIQTPCQASHGQVI